MCKWKPKFASSPVSSPQLFSGWTNFSCFVFTGTLLFLAPSLLLDNASNNPQRKTPVVQMRRYCWWFRNPAFTSWGLVVLSHYLQGFIHPRWLFGISSINSMTSGKRNQTPWGYFRIVRLSMILDMRRFCDANGKKWTKKHSPKWWWFFSSHGVPICKESPQKNKSKWLIWPNYNISPTWISLK